MRTGKRGLRPGAVNGLVLLLLLMNQPALSLFGGSGSYCTCRLYSSKTSCCSFNITPADHRRPLGMICHCHDPAEKKIEFRQGCRCGLDREADKPTSMVPAFWASEWQNDAAWPVYKKDSGMALPGFKNPLIKPPPSSRQI